MCTSKKCIWFFNWGPDCSPASTAEVGWRTGDLRSLAELDSSAESLQDALYTALNPVSFSRDGKIHHGSSIGSRRWWSFISLIKVSTRVF